MTTITTTMYEAVEPSLTTSQQQQEYTQGPTTVAPALEITTQMFWDQAMGMLYMLLLMAVALIAYELIVNKNEDIIPKIMHLLCIVVMVAAVVIINVIYTQTEWGNNLEERNWISIMSVGLFLAAGIYGLLWVSGRYKNTNGTTQYGKITIQTLLRVGVTLFIAYYINVASNDKQLA